MQQPGSQSGQGFQGDYGNLSSRAQNVVHKLINDPNRIGEVTLRQLAQETKDPETFNEVCTWAYQNPKTKQQIT